MRRAESRWARVFQGARGVQSHFVHPEQPSLFIPMVSGNMEPPIVRRWTELEKDPTRTERMMDEEPEELEPPPVVVRRKVSFADAFGLDLVSVKEYDNRDVSGLDLQGFLGTDRRDGVEYYITCLFNVSPSHQEMETRLEKQKLELVNIQMLPGCTTLRGIIRVLNLSFHKAVYVRTTLDGWRSHFDLRAEYVPGYSDGRTDRFCFHIMLTPPFQKEGLQVEFCLRYETDGGHHWANNNGSNYTLFCHQRRRNHQNEKDRDMENDCRGIKGCLKTISKKTSGGRESSEYVTPRANGTRENTTHQHTEIASSKSNKDCCKKSVDQREQRQACLTRIQELLAHKAVETQLRCYFKTDSGPQRPIIMTHAPHPDWTLESAAHSYAHPGLSSEDNCLHTTESRETQYDTDKSQSPHQEQRRGSSDQEAVKKSQNVPSEITDGISTRDDSSLSDTLNKGKVEDNTKRRVKDVLTFTEIRGEVLADIEGSLENRDLNKNTEVETEREKDGEGMYEDTERGRKNDEVMLESNRGTRSVSLCGSGRELHLKGSWENEERHFETNGRLEERLIETTTTGSVREVAGADEDEEHPKTKDLKRTSGADNCLDGATEALKMKQQNIPFPHIITPIISTEALKSVKLGSSEQARSHEDETQVMDGADLPSVVTSSHQSWADARSMMMSWGQKFRATSHVTKLLVFVILLVVFVTSSMFDMPTCVVLYLLSLCLWCKQGTKKHLDVSVSE